ncbi:MAG: hypothetical protein MHM6MM_002138 [Cercozoa sp. M6MM]
MTNCCIFGPPGAGKGTQCERIVEEFGMVHLSTGNILRAAVEADNDLGRKAKEYMDRGELVPSDLINAIVLEKLKQPDVQSKGWLLDGYPRTAGQAQLLKDNGLLPDVFLCLDVPREVLEERVTGRRLDPETGNVYHIKYRPAPREIQDRLVQRPDDTAEKLHVRLNAYEDNLASVRPFFVQSECVVDGSKNMSEVTDMVLDAIAQHHRAHAQAEV